MDNFQPLLLSPDQARRVLNMSRSKLYQEMTAGHLKYVNNGRRRFIHREEAERYAKALAPAPKG